MRLRDLYEDIEGGSGSATLRAVPRIKSRVSTSLCAGNCRGQVFAQRVATAYVYDRACFCSSPEDHAAQFLAGGAPGRSGH
jgi:hypothetical protein